MTRVLHQLHMLQLHEFLINSSSVIAWRHTHGWTGLRTILCFTASLAANYIHRHKHNICTLDS